MLTHNKEESVAAHPLMILRLQNKLGFIHVLKFYPNDDAFTVAQQYGLEAGLDQGAIAALSQQIREYVGQVKTQGWTPEPNSSTASKYSSVTQAQREGRSDSQ